MDSSPFGMGSVLEVDGVTLHYIETEISEADVSRYHHQRGADTGQQTWESLIVLISFRPWRSFWHGVRVQLAVRGDNRGALSLLLTLRSKGDGPISVGRELALDLGDGTYAPAVVEHLPGAANDLTDELSRRTDPRHQPWSLPSALHSVSRTEVPARDSSYYYVK